MADIDLKLIHMVSGHPRPYEHLIGLKNLRGAGKQYLFNRAACTGKTIPSVKFKILNFLSAEYESRQSFIASDAQGHYFEGPKSLGECLFGGQISK